MIVMVGLCSGFRPVHFAQRFSVTGSCNKFISKQQLVLQAKFKDDNEVLSLRQEILRILPIASFTVGLMGIAFQVLVLYPWHEELSK